jgi:hypothetical protein
LSLKNNKNKKWDPFVLKCFTVLPIMSATNNVVIVDLSSKGKGKGMVATKNFIEGEIVFQEKQPLICVQHVHDLNHKVGLSLSLLVIFF